MMLEKRVSGASGAFQSKILSSSFDSCKLFSDYLRDLVFFSFRDEHFSGRVIVIFLSVPEQMLEKNRYDSAMFCAGLSRETLKHTLGNVFGCLKMSSFARKLLFAPRIVGNIEFGDRSCLRGSNLGLG